MRSVFAGTLGTDTGVDVLGRDRLEYERAIAMSRIVAVRSVPGWRELKSNELEPGRFGTLVAPDGTRYRQYAGLAFDRGQLVERLPESVSGFVIRADLDPPVVVMLERVVR